MKTMINWFSRHHKSLIALLFLICVLVSFGIKTYHYNNAVETLGAAIEDVPPAQRTKIPFLLKFLPHYHNHFSPFTIESGMMFSYAQSIAEGKGVPKSDPLLLGQTDLPPYAQMIMGLEWFLGWGHRLKNAIVADPSPTTQELRFQDHPYMAQWMSTQIRLWASLTTGFLFLWLIVLRCPTGLAFTAAMIHAVAVASVARATGQDFVRGEFCMPFLMATLCLAHSCYLRGVVWKWGLLFLSAFCAMTFWDLSLMFFSAWSVFELLRYLLSGRVTRRRQIAWGILYGAILVSALVVPFNRAYSLWRAPLVLVLLPSLLIVMFAGRHRGIGMRFALALGVPVLLYGVWMWGINTPEYASNYSHFSELMKAKLKYMNVKPQNPSLLSYDARIMWTPSMHSATWQELIAYFPGLQIGLFFGFKPIRFLLGFIPITLGYFYLLLGLGALLSLPRRVIRNGLPRSLMPFLFTVGFTIGFIYIVRYHEFLILFLLVSLPLLLHDYLRGLRYRPFREGDEAYWRICSSRKWLKFLRISLLGMFGFCLFLETTVSLLSTRRYTGDVQMRDTANLIAWFRRHEKTRGRGVISNITIDPMMKAYCGSAIALNPQFGLERLRKPTEHYLNLLFHGTEKQLAAYCEELGVSYLIYNKGCILGGLHPYSMRYIADAAQIAGDAPANLFYYTPNKLNYFYRIDPPKDLRGLSRSYSVFRIIRAQEKVMSVKLQIAAEMALEDGDLPFAERAAVNAAVLDPCSNAARLLFFKLFKRLPEITLDGIQ